MLLLSNVRACFLKLQVCTCPLTAMAQVSSLSDAKASRSASPASRSLCSRPYDLMRLLCPCAMRSPSYSRCTWGLCRVCKCGGQGSSAWNLIGTVCRMTAFSGMLICHKTKISVKLSGTSHDPSKWTSPQPNDHSLFPDSLVLKPSASVQEQHTFPASHLQDPL